LSTLARRRNEFKRSPRFALSESVAAVYKLLYPLCMSTKSAKIAALIEDFRDQGLDAHYLGFFACFNRGLFYESHEVLEELWLVDRQGPNGYFYKGLIQLAGAFVHLQKDRLRPSAALFKLAQTNLGKYPSVHEHLDTATVLRLIDNWLNQLESAQFAVNPLITAEPPEIRLLACR
jgi:predicted metal-dependent hydrolase